MKPCVQGRQCNGLQAPRRAAGSLHTPRLNLDWVTLSEVVRRAGKFHRFRSTLCWRLARHPACGLNSQAKPQRVTREIYGPHQFKDDAVLRQAAFEHVLRLAKILGHLTARELNPGFSVLGSTASAFHSSILSAASSSPSSCDFCFRSERCSRGLLDASGTTISAGCTARSSRVRKPSTTHSWAPTPMRPTTDGVRWMVCLMHDSNARKEVCDDPNSKGIRHLLDRLSRKSVGE